MVRFLQTGDWQLGMARHFFSGGVQERFAQARFDSIRRLVRLAKDEKCDFIAVCGDLFDSNLVDRKTVARAIEALRESSIPIFVLPGNHDPLDASSILTSKGFLEKKPGNVVVLSTSEPFQLGDRVEVIGIPWLSKKTDHDIVAEALARLEPAGSMTRIVLAHGILNSLSPDPDDLSLINLETAEKAIRDGRITFLALGDRHSTLSAGSTGRVWYAGSPEPTDFREDDAGNILVVAVSDRDCRVEKHKISTWEFIERDSVDVNSDEDINLLRGWIESLDNKERTVVKLRLSGTLSLNLHARLDEVLDHAHDLLAALELREKDLVIIPDDEDFSEIAISGFAAKAVEKLRSSARTQDEAGRRACNALALLLRLHRGTL